MRNVCDCFAYTVTLLLSKFLDLVFKPKLQDIIGNINGPKRIKKTISLESNVWLKAPWGVFFGKGPLKSTGQGPGSPVSNHNIRISEKLFPIIKRVYKKCENYKHGKNSFFVRSQFSGLIKSPQIPISPKYLRVH